MWDQLWQSFFNAIWSEILSFAGWAGQLLEAPSQDDEFNAQLDSGDHSSSSFTDYGSFIDFTGGSLSDPFTASSTDDPFGIVWTRDPFTTVADEGPDLGNGEVDNPFPPPSPDDPSGMLASNDVYYVDNYGRLSTRPWGESLGPQPDVPTDDPEQTLFTPPSVQTPPTLDRDWSTMAKTAFPQTGAPPTTVSSGISSPYETDSTFTPEQADAPVQSDLPASFADPLPAFPPIDTWPTASLGATQSDPMTSTPNNMISSSSSFSPDAQPSSGLNQPSVFTQVLRGTYAESVLQQQLANQGRQPGVFVSPVLPFDSLFNPNATSLGGATLLASHSPNEPLREAQEAELAASMTPFVGSIATWMNPRSGPFAKGIATIGFFASAFSLASAISREAAQVGSELGSLGDELPPLEPEETASSALQAAYWRTQQVEELLQDARNAGLRVSASGPASWTQRQMEALNAYSKAAARVYQETEDMGQAAGAGGDVFHRVLGAPGASEPGVDLQYFGANVEVKTSFGTPDVSDFLNWMEKSESDEPWQLAAVHVFDTLNQVKYFVLRGP